jgi:putative sterol carrier protein
MALSRWGLKLLEAPRPEEETRAAWAMVALQSSLDLKAAPARKEIYEFRVDGGLFHVQVEGDGAEVRQGRAADPDLIISGDTETLLSVAAGRLTLAEAVEAGAIATEGDKDSLARCLAMLGSPDGDGGKSVREDIRAQQAR